MINHFRAQIPLPLIGVGHSMGGNCLVNLALIHPRLFTTLILLDPVISKYSSTPPSAAASPAQASTYRRDIWPSRAAAEASFRKSKFYQTWDPRVLDLWCRYGIRETPTAHHAGGKGEVTLTTTKHQECFTFLRPSWDAVSEDSETVLDRSLVPELRPDTPAACQFPFYRPEPNNTLARLPELRPSVFYIFGEVSYLSAPGEIQQKMEITGAGPGGSGGAKEGRVAEVTLKNVGHLVAMEASQECADAAAAWVGKELKRWEEGKRQYVEWTKQSLEAKTTLSEEWKKRIGNPRKKTSKL